VAWEVYIVRTQSGRLYTGIAKDPDKRFMEHLEDRKKGAKFFRFDPPEKIVFRKKKKSRSEAQRLEYQIKSLSRREKLELLHPANS